MNLNIRNKRKKTPKRSNDPSWTASTSKHFLPSFAMAQGVGECLKVCLYGGIDVKMNGCVWMKVVLKWE
ncbi:hypothetical protein ACFX11_003463 [Malus domestica]